jgi:hypothetical protein
MACWALRPKCGVYSHSSISLVFSISGSEAGTWRILYPAASWCQLKICSSTSARAAGVSTMELASRLAAFSGRSDSDSSQSDDTSSALAQAPTTCALGSRAPLSLSSCEMVDRSTPMARASALWLMALACMAWARRLRNCAARKRLSIFPIMW